MKPQCGQLLDEFGSSSKAHKFIVRDRNVPRQVVAFCEVAAYMTEDQLQLHFRQGQAEDVLAKACKELHKKYMPSSVIARAASSQELDRRRRQMDRLKRKGLAQTAVSGETQADDQANVLQKRRAEQVAELPESMRNAIEGSGDTLPARRTPGVGRGQRKPTLRMSTKMTVAGPALEQESAVALFFRPGQADATPPAKSAGSGKSLGGKSPSCTALVPASQAPSLAPDIAKPAGTQAPHNYFDYPAIFRGDDRGQVISGAERTQAAAATKGQWGLSGKIGRELPYAKAVLTLANGARETQTPDDLEAALKVSEEAELDVPVQVLVSIYGMAMVRRFAQGLQRHDGRRPTHAFR